jgi:4-amino-4-deoxy-L-arabinose transferase-like glycosyltransferase
LLAVVIAGTALCFRLGHLPLLQPDEGRNAEVAREMRESGAWLVPTYNGVAYLDKPAFYFRAVALSLALFGNTETAARIPSALFGLGLLALAYAFCRREHGARCAALTVIVVATTPLYLANARTVIFDIALAFFTCAAIFAGYRAEATEGKSRRNWYLAGAASAGVATLVKGPVGFLIPALVLLAFHGIERRRGVLKRFFAPLNLVVFFGVVLPWFVGVSLAQPDFPHYGLVEESFRRFTTPKFQRTEPVYFYALIVAGTFFPWSLLLPEAGVAAWKLRWVRTRADRLCLVWFAVVIVFFSCSQSKLPGYILTAAVACGILVARLFDVALGAPAERPARVIGHATVTLAVGCVVAAAALAVLAPRVHLLARPLRIPVADATRLADSATPMMTLLLVFAVVGLFARFRQDVRIAFACFALLPVLLVTVNVGVAEVIFEAKSSRSLARQLPVLPPNTEIACFDCFPNGLPFYLGRTVTLITRDGRQLTSNYVLFRLKTERNWPANLVRLDDFDQWLATRSHPVYLIAKQDRRSVLDRVAADRKAVVAELPPIHVGVLLPPAGGS